MSPGHWCDTLSRDRALTAAMQLHKDACHMQTNLDILDQYALALHGTASTILQRTIGGASFPSTEVLTGAPGAHARRVSVYRWRRSDYGDLRWTLCSLRQHDPEHVQQDGCSGVMNNSCIERFILGGPDIRSRDSYIVVIYVYSYFSMSP